MTRIRFENLPSTNTPRNAENLNKLNNVVISSTEPTTGEEVWLQKGKNLFNNYTIINGWIYGTGMRVNSANGNRMAFIKCKPNTTYTISRSVKTTTFRVGDYTIIPPMTNSNVDYTIPTIAENNDGETITYTTTASAKYLIIHYGTVEDTNLSQSFATIQVEQGSTATTYEAYIDKKIYTKNNNDVYEEFYEEVKSDTFKNEEMVVGSIRSKNMFDKNNPGIVVGYGLSSSDGGLASNPQRTTSYFIEIKPSTNYVLSGATFAAKVFYDSNKTFISSTVETNFITPSNAKYFRFAWNNTIDFSQLQLEQGSQATNFMPYQDLDGMETYSTNEIRIGTWIDGKPLYRQVFNVTNITSSNTNFQRVDNVDTPVKLYGFLTSSTSNKFPMPTVDNASSNYNVMFWSPGANSIRGRAVVGDGGSFQSAIVIFEYTKTTD